MSLPVAQWLERPTGVRKVMGSIPVGDSDFFFAHARDMMFITSFLRYQVVRIHSAVSDPLPVECGVLRGSILGSLLLTI